MAQERNFTSSGSKSRDTHGSEPSQDDVRDGLRGDGAPQPRKGRLADGSPKLESGEGLSGDSAGEEALDKGDSQRH